MRLFLNLYIYVYCYLLKIQSILINTEMMININIVYILLPSKKKKKNIGAFFTEYRKYKFFLYNIMLVKIFSFDVISFMPVLHVRQQVSFLFCFIRAHVAFELRLFTALPALMVQQ